nr:hypothetical transcript [Hymenolepis microstoma]
MFCFFSNLLNVSLLPISRARVCYRSVAALWITEFRCQYCEELKQQVKTFLAIVVFWLPSISGFLSLSAELNTVSGGSSPFPPVGHIRDMLVGRILLFYEGVSPGNRVRIADCESERITALVKLVSWQNNWPNAIVMSSISPSNADLFCPAAAKKEDSSE